jgi:bifunctional UDP-N-acetylglucosamine pyrophosphorylase/glucosamine-1-phosphate N-acetyltransferase
MQAIILAAGNSSRFYPFNDFHKSLIRILGKPIIEHTLAAVKKAGIEDVIIVVGKDNAVREQVEKIEDLGLRIQYVIQEKASGAGEALLLAERYIKDDFFLLNANRVDFFESRKILESKNKEKNEVVLLARKITNSFDSAKLGVLKIEDDNVIEIVEKPLLGEEPSDLSVVGIYLLNKLFLDILREAPKDHYSLEKAISQYARKESVKYVVTTGDNISLKYPWDILLFKNHMLASLKRYISATSNVAPSAQLIGEIYVDDNATIMENAVIKGPCYIGKNVFIGNNVILRSGVDVEENSVIGANMEIKNVLLMENSKTHSGFIGDSVIGINCRIGAGFNTANVRLDRETVKVSIQGQKIDTGLKSLGVMIGNGTRIGLKSSAMPGIVVGKNAVIGSGTSIIGNVEDHTKYYTKFQEVVVKKNE